MTTLPRIVWLPMTALVLAPARAAARRICLYLSDPVVPGAELYPGGAHAALFDPSSSSKSIQSAILLARLVRKGGTHGSR